ncbi:hypothetical protein HDV57DRAFT_487909 [Trichoderma longibrachiatum]|uniref:Secreted protein n=1 Tax=Trichoderma longibrachiatum ATCC 18648 TaxID=983965 RepID=A0A2T4BY93_TRILO|nr:hypothetical protein M440DRAFT_110029 [Trichoderma longibrachiatum ATCC 18648]
MLLQLRFLPLCLAQFAYCRSFIYHFCTIYISGIDVSDSYLYMTRTVDSPVQDRRARDRGYAKCYKRSLYINLPLSMLQPIISTLQYLIPLLRWEKPLQSLT